MPHARSPAWRQSRRDGQGDPAACPSVNPARFQDRAKADKWFKRNCNDTVGRDCTAAEKADVLAYLISLGGAK